MARPPEADGRAYAQMMGTRPQTLYGLADSPVGLAAWLFDHGDGYGQPAAAITSAVLGRTVTPSAFTAVWVGGSTPTSS